ncbi:MAG: M3 family metallopeptidase [bacterium]
MTARPPRWDLAAWFEDFGPGFDGWLDRCAATLAALDARADALGALTEERAPTWAGLLAELEAVSADLQHAGAYATARAAADVEDGAANAATARVTAIGAAAEGLEARVVAALGAASPAAFAALRGEAKLAGAAYRLDRWRARARRAMAPGAERLAADLAVDGLQAWARLYRQITSAMTFEAEGETLPLAWLRGELERPEAKRRAAALAGASRALEAQAPALVAALNGIAGARLTLDRHRGVPDPLDEACFESAIDRETLDAMMGVVEEEAEIARRFLRLKAKLAGRETVRWCDLRAPLAGAEGAVIDWPGARAAVIDAFERHHPALAQFAGSMFDAGHIEADPRRGKRPGAFCTRSLRAEDSRVYLSYTGHAADVRTLAHELGHAYHNHAMRGLRPWARQYPMTLAETASIVAETLISDAWLADPDVSDAARRRVLDARLGQIVVYLLDIPTRFHFERALYAERARGELSPARACALMAEAQRAVFGDVLDGEGLHPWFWAEKLHFYLPGRRFYNFPYTFGYLFGQGVLARARAAGVEVFQPTWIELLRRTGQGSVETIAADVLGVDLRGRDFWHDALAEARADLAAFEALVGAR